MYDKIGYPLKGTCIAIHYPVLGFTFIKFRIS